MKARNRFFIAGSILLILTAIAHTLGTLLGGTASNDDEKKLLDLMNNLVLQSPDGIRRTMMDIYIGISLSQALLTVTLAAIDIAVIRSKATDELVRNVLWVNVSMIALLLIPTFKYTVLPAMIMYSLAWLCFLIAFAYSKQKLSVD